MKKILKHTTLLLISLFLVSGTLFLAHQEAQGQSFVPVHDKANTMTNQTNAKTNAGHLKNDAWHTGKWYAKEYVLDGAIWEFAKKIIMDEIKQTMMSWASDGFDGEPSFVENPSNFFGGLGISIADRYINDNLSFLCDDFESEIKAALKYRYKENTEHEQNLECTLDDAMANLSGIYDDFTSGDFYEGGYEALFAITQNDRNNPYGAYRRSSENIESEIARKQHLAEMELSWGSGFFSGREGGAITMPGDIGKEQLNHFIQSDIRQLENVDELTEGVALLAGALVGGMMEDGGDLSGGSTGGEEWNWEEEEDDDPTGGALEDPEELDEESESPDQDHDSTLSGQSFTADIEEPNIEIDTGDNQKSLQNISLDNVTGLNFIGDNDDGESIKTGSSDIVEVDSITFRYQDGTTDQTIEGAASYPQAVSETLSNVYVKDPVFQTIEGSTEVDPGGNKADGVHYLGSVRFNGDEAIKAEMTDANVGGDNDLSDSNLEGSYILQDSKGSGIDKVTMFQPHSTGYQEHNKFSFDKNDLRGGVIEVNSIDNVRIVSGTIVDEDGNTMTDSNGNDYEIATSYCGSSNCSLDDYTANGVSGEGLHIDDTSSNAWSYQSYGWADEQSVSVPGDFTMDHGIIKNVY